MRLAPGGRTQESAWFGEDPKNQPEQPIIDLNIAAHITTYDLDVANNAGPHDRLLSLTTRLGGMAGRLEADRHWQAPDADRHWLWQGDTAIMDWHNLVEGRRVEDVDIAAVALGQFVRPVYGHDAGRRARQD